MVYDWGRAGRRLCSDCASGVWSDLHLSDRAALAAWTRPFQDTDERKAGNYEQ